jgi:hypothetical protein
LLAAGSGADPVDSDRDGSYLRVGEPKRLPAWRHLLEGCANCSPSLHLDTER